MIFCRNFGHHLLYLLSCLGVAFPFPTNGTNPYSNKRILHIVKPRHRRLQDSRAYHLWQDRDDGRPPLPGRRLSDLVAPANSPTLTYQVYDNATFRVAWTFQVAWSDWSCAVKKPERRVAAVARL